MSARVASVWREEPKVSLLGIRLFSHPIFLHIIFFLIHRLIQGLVGAPACGDVMKLQIKVGDDGRIIESKFKTFGCGSAIASSSVATEWVKGKTVDEVLSIKNSDIAAHLKLPPVKLHCSMLAEDAIRASVADWKAKQQAKEAAGEEVAAAQAAM
jgi:Fe-S cluster assembly scaffold IscU